MPTTQEYQNSDPVRSENLHYNPLYQPQSIQKLGWRYFIENTLGNSAKNWKFKKQPLNRIRICFYGTNWQQNNFGMHYDGTWSSDDT